MARKKITLKQAKQNKIAKVMREYKDGELNSGGTGKKVKSRKQAIAIALSEASRLSKNNSNLSLATFAYEDEISRLQKQIQGYQEQLAAEQAKPKPSNSEIKLLNRRIKSNQDQIGKLQVKDAAEKARKEQIKNPQPKPKPTPPPPPVQQAKPVETPKPTAPDFKYNQDELVEKRKVKKGTFGKRAKNKNANRFEVVAKQTRKGSATKPPKRRISLPESVTTTTRKDFANGVTVEPRKVSKPKSKVSRNTKSTIKKSQIGLVPTTIRRKVDSEEVFNKSNRAFGKKPKNKNANRFEYVSKPTRKNAANKPQKRKIELPTTVISTKGKNWANGLPVEPRKVSKPKSKISRNTQSVIKKSQLDSVPKEIKRKMTVDNSFQPTDKRFGRRVVKNKINNPVEAISKNVRTNLPVEQSTSRINLPDISEFPQRPKNPKRFDIQRKPTKGKKIIQVTNRYGKKFNRRIYGNLNQPKVTLPLNKTLRPDDIVDAVNKATGKKIPYSPKVNDPPNIRLGKNQKIALGVGAGIGSLFLINKLMKRNKNKTAKYSLSLSNLAEFESEAQRKLKLYLDKLEEYRLNEIKELGKPNPDQKAIEKAKRWQERYKKDLENHLKKHPELKPIVKKNSDNNQQSTQPKTKTKIELPEKQKPTPKGNLVYKRPSKNEIRALQEANQIKVVKVTNQKGTTFTRRIKVKPDNVAQTINQNYKNIPKEEPPKVKLNPEKVGNTVKNTTKKVAKKIKLSKGGIAAVAATGVIGLGAGVALNRKDKKESKYSLSLGSIAEFARPIGARDKKKRKSRLLSIATHPGTAIGD